MKSRRKGDKQFSTSSTKSKSDSSTPKSVDPPFVLKQQLFSDDVFQLYGVSGKNESEFSDCSKCVKIVERKKITNLESLESDISKLSRIKENNHLLSYSKFSPYTYQKGKNVWIPVMERIQHYSNIERVLEKRFINDESILSVLSFTILSALERVHSIDFTVRDLSPHSILLLWNSSEKDLKIKVDPISIYGNIVPSRNRRRLSFSSNPLRAPPELLKNGGRKNVRMGSVSIKNDIYLLGMLLIECYTGTLSRSDHHTLDAINSISQTDPSNNEKDFKLLFDTEQKYRSTSKLFRSFLKQCLVKDPLKRPTSTELLKHEFISKYKGSDNESKFRDFFTMYHENNDDEDDMIHLSDDESTTSDQGGINDRKKVSSGEDDNDHDSDDISNSSTSSSTKMEEPKVSNPSPSEGHHFYLSPNGEDPSTSSFWQPEVEHKVSIVEQKKNDNNNNHQPQQQQRQKFGISKMYLGGKKKRRNNIQRINNYRHRPIAPTNLWYGDRAPMQVKQAPMQMQSAPMQAPMQPMIPQAPRQVSKWNRSGHNYQQQQQPNPTPQYNNSIMYGYNQPQQPQQQQQQQYYGSSSSSSSSTTFDPFFSSPQSQQKPLSSYYDRSSESFSSSSASSNSPFSSISIRGGGGGRGRPTSSSGSMIISPTSSTTTSSPNTEEETTELEKRFNVIKYLGGGSFGRVFQVSYKDQKKAKKRGTIALKRIECTNMEEVNECLNEVFALKNIKHPNIINIFGGFIGKVKNSYFCNIEMEYLNGGDLSQIMDLEDVSEEFVLQMIKQIGSALKLIHHHKIIHRDVSPRNICLILKSNDTQQQQQQKSIEERIKEIATNNQNEDIEGYPIRFVLVDFGFVRLLEESMSRSFGLGTFSFISPELALQQPYDTKSDIFSFGACVFSLLSKFKGQIFAALSMLGKTKLERQLLEKDLWSRELISLVWRMIEMDQEKRINAKQLVELVNEI